MCPGTACERYAEYTGSTISKPVSLLLFPLSSCSSLPFTPSLHILSSLLFACLDMMDSRENLSIHVHFTATGRMVSEPSLSSPSHPAPTHSCCRVNTKELGNSSVDRTVAQETVLNRHCFFRGNASRTPLASDCASALSNTALKPTFYFFSHFLSQMPVISVSLKNMLFGLSFMARSGPLSACDEQISGPNGIQTRQLCYARVALGEEGAQDPLTPSAGPSAAPVRIALPQFSEDCVQRGAKGGPEPSVARSCEFLVDTLFPSDGSMCPRISFTLALTLWNLWDGGQMATHFFSNPSCSLIPAGFPGPCAAFIKIWAALTQPQEQGPSSVTHWSLPPQT